MIIENIRLIPTIPFYGTRGIWAALQLQLEISVGLFAGGMTVPSRSIPAHSFRLFLLVWLTPKILDYATNRQYSFGNLLLDQILLSLPGWKFLSCLVDIALLPIFVSSVPPPQSIRPTQEEITRLSKLRALQETSINSRNHAPHQSEQKPEQAWEEMMPRQWEVIKFPPPFSMDRVLYAFDYLTLLRPGTSWLFPWQFRAFDWSLPALTSGSVGGRKFGRAETYRKVAMIYSLIYLLVFTYVNNMVIQVIGTITMDQLDPIHQLLLTVSAGCLIYLSSAPMEANLFPWLISKHIVPPTALLADFNHPYMAESVQSFWGVRWHHGVRRQITRIASLFPLGSSRTGNALWASFVSGMLHSFIIARSQPEPNIQDPLSYMRLFFDAYTIMFFVSQGITMVLEKWFIPKQLHRIWLWFTILFTGRWYMYGVLDSYVPAE